VNEALQNGSPPYIPPEARESSSATAAEQVSSSKGVHSLQFKCEFKMSVGAQNAATRTIALVLLQEVELCFIFPGPPLT